MGGVVIAFLGSLVEQWGGDGDTSSSGGFNNRRTRGRHVLKHLHPMPISKCGSQGTRWYRCYNHPGLPCHLGTLSL